jgi:hypothetical protein
VSLSHHVAGRGLRSLPQQVAGVRPEQGPQRYSTRRSTTQISSSVVSLRRSFLVLTRPGQAGCSTVHDEQPAGSRRPNDQGVEPHPGMQIGSQSTSYSTFGIFFVPGEHTQIASRPHVAPHRMQAGAAGAADAVSGLPVIFSGAAAPAVSVAAKSAAASVAWRGRTARMAAVSRSRGQKSKSIRMP